MYVYTHIHIYYTYIHVSLYIYIYVYNASPCTGRPFGSFLRHALSNVPWSLPLSPFGLLSPLYAMRNDEHRPQTLARPAYLRPGVWDGLNRNRTADLQLFAGGPWNGNFRLIRIRIRRNFARRRRRWQRSWVRWMALVGNCELDPPVGVWFAMRCWFWSRAQPEAVPGHSRRRCWNDPTTCPKPHSPHKQIIHIYITKRPKAFLAKDELWWRGELVRLREAEEAEALYRRLYSQLHAPGTPSQLGRLP